MSRPSFAVVLPARYGSTRFPGKPLATIAGRPLIEWVHRRALSIEGASAVLVATDDERIAEAVNGFGGRLAMTSADHKTGTDRVAEVARALEEDVIVNLQGDEPVFDPAMVEAMVEGLGMNNEWDIATACHAIGDRSEFENANVVKVVVASDGRALYFSRAPIPNGALDSEEARAMRHVGVYAFRRQALSRFASLERTPLEKSERLEQLRALENGMCIGVIETERQTVGVDVPGDLKNVEKLLSSIYTD
jgi:3-deoxy-manno-octulosonate cytidylyltransferase (CMP-KDO synthetase)